jgi:hypothetical protein
MDYVLFWLAIAISFIVVVAVTIKWSRRDDDDDDIPYDV